MVTASPPGEALAAYCTDPIDYTTDSTVDSGWVPVVMTFTPQVTGTASAYIIGEGAQGIFYVDDIQLEKGEAPSNFNLLENGDLQSDNTSAFGWTLKEDVSFCNTVGVNASGTRRDKGTVLLSPHLPPNR